MLRNLFSAFSVLLLLFIGFVQGEQGDIGAEPQEYGVAGEAKPLQVLPPSVAGSFYPANADRLSADVAMYLESAALPEIEGEIIAAIVPHAGYIYSAPVAAYAYKAIAEQVKKRKEENAKELDAVFVVAFDHKGRHSTVSVYYEGAMRTPLGTKPVHEKIAREFMDVDPRLSFSQLVFMGEWSAEVQIPFIQTILPDIPIVPVVFGHQSFQNVDAVSRGLEKIARSHNILVVGTTDLSHYRPYEEANALDAQTVELMIKRNPQEMARYINEHPDRMCGPGPVISVLAYAESQGAEPVMLKYANSGDTAGRKDGVVGYAALVFVKKDGLPQQSEGSKVSESVKEETEESTSEYLDEDEKAILLKLARRSVESYVRDRKIIDVSPPESEKLRQNGAAFVTLKKNGRLRGCIGNMEPSMPLYQTVIQMAVAAASQDHRFTPVRPDELDDIHIEISVNTPLKRVGGADEIVLGKHGVVVEKGLRRGVFLPQVATETGWSKEEFLGNLCAQKAGLPPDSYKRDARLYVFSSIVFEEHK